jgi:tetratricopeptide (TPR) repeat protein
MQWIIGLTLRPGRSYLEVTTKLFNRTPIPHSMLCFTNAAVSANRDYQVIFPPNTQFGTYHAKGEFVHWPIGNEAFLGLDRTGVDLSWWKNQPSPVSIFAWNYQDDFFGGYDHGKQAGVIHVADHHVVPGKKFFTFGCGDEGKVWDKMLTDDDGPYVELMAGAYSDNQPDYSWIAPYETREVHEYWYPVRGLGGVKNANREAAVNLEVDASGVARIAVNTTWERRDARVTLTAAGKTVFKQTTVIAPDRPFTAKVTVPPKTPADEIRLAVWVDEKELIHYQPAKPHVDAMPKPVVPPAAPKDIKTNDELYQIGLRLEQFQHPTLMPYPYYEEAIRRDPGDSHANTALGILYCKRGMFAEAEQHLNAAVARITDRYTTPKDAEAFYYLGVALCGQGRDAQAAEAFYKATWDASHSAAAFYALAENACRKGDFADALRLLELSAKTNACNIKAAGLKAMALRKLGRCPESLAVVRETQQADPLDDWTANEACLNWNAQGNNRAVAEAKANLRSLLRDDAESSLELASNYEQCNAWNDAVDVLTRFVDVSTDRRRVHPMVYYHLAFCCDRAGNAADAKHYWKLAAEMPRDDCFPHRLESIGVLERAVAANPDDASAPYYLGNLLYDIQPQRAIAAWEKSRALCPQFAMVHRNLGLAYARIEKNYPKAAESLAKAISIDASDPLAFAEYDSIAEQAGVAPVTRLAMLEKNAATVAKRDDALLRQVKLCNLLKHYDESLALLAGHPFHRWENDSTSHEMYVEARLGRGSQRLLVGKPREAKADFAAALEYPANFQVGRPLCGDLKAAQIHYLMGLANEALGLDVEARQSYEQSAASNCGSKVKSMHYYRALARRKLGDAAAAEQELKSLITAGEDVLKQGPVIDFFGPDDLQPEQQQKAEAHYSVALGLLGTGRVAQARQQLQLAVGLNPTYSDAIDTLSSCEKDDRRVDEMKKANHNVVKPK